MATIKEQNGSSNPVPHKHKPTRKELITISLFITITTLVGLWLFAWVFNDLDKYKVRAEVKWDNKENYVLDAGPSWFLYHQKEGKLMAISVIGDSAKANLLQLYNRDSLGYSAYKNAIEELAFATNNLPKPSYLLTLLIGGIAAFLGVQIRTVHRFVLRACYVQDLNIHVWWPWYVLRPVMGFLLGSTVVLLSQVNLLSVNTNNASLYFWIGLAILAGFGAPDVVDRLYLVSKTLFGTGGSERQAPEEETVVDTKASSGGGSEYRKKPKEVKVLHFTD